MKSEVYCISYRRPKNVPKIQEMVGRVIWVVGDMKDVDDYIAEGAKKVIIGGGLCESRNAALEHAFKNDNICIQISDDLKHVFKIIDKKTKEKIPFKEAREMMVTDLLHWDAYLVGVAPTANAFFFNKDYQFDKFIVGDMIAVRPNPLRFDQNLKLKEDYDYTVQHLKKYGSVLRLNRLAPEFLHRTNKGGAVDFRTAEREQEAIQYLFNKWPGFFKMNARRPNEILLTL